MSWVKTPFHSVMLLLLISGMFYHMQLGIQVVIEDYIHNEGAKIILMMLQKLASIALAVAASFAVLKIAFGG